MSSPRDQRRADLARIHIGKAQLRMDDETYRAMLWSVARVHSAKDLDDAGRRAVIQHLKARGFRDEGRTRGRPHNMDHNQVLRRIEALLADAQRPWSYADAMALRMFHVDRVQFLKPVQQHKLMVALSMDQRRRAEPSAAEPA